MSLKSFRELHAWQHAMSLVEHSFAVSDAVRRNRRFSISNQLESACISVPSNIAEGYGRNTLPDYSRFLHYSMGSLRETETLLLITGRVRAAPVVLIESALDVCDETARVLYGLQRSLR